MAAETISLPGLGPTKRTYVYAGGALVAGIVVYAWWQRGASGGGVAPTPELEPFQPELAPADLTTVSTGGGTSDTGLTFITTNAEWSEAAIAKMVELGYDSIAVSTALGKFLANQAVTVIEASYINTALALQGKPPVGEHSIRLETVSPTPSPTTGAKLATPTGLHVIRQSPKGVTFGWNRVPGAQWYLVLREDPPPKLPAIVRTNTRTTPPLRKDYRYIYRVTAHAAGRPSSDRSAMLEFRSRY